MNILIKLLVYPGIYIFIMFLLMNPLVSTKLVELLPFSPDYLFTFVSLAFIVILVFLEGRACPVTKPKVLEKFSDIQLKVLQDYTKAARVNSYPQLNEFLGKLANAFSKSTVPGENKLGEIVRDFASYINSEAKDSVKDYVIKAINGSGNSGDAISGLTGVVRSYVSEKGKSAEVSQILTSLLIDTVYKTRIKNGDVVAEAHLKQTENMKKTVETGISSGLKTEIEKSGEAQKEGYAAYF